jgi:hypothetical protein
MDKLETSTVVDHANACWNKNPYNEDLKIQKRAWHALLQDLAFEDVMRVINRMAITSAYPPRPGEVRREVIMGKLPLAMAAWSELQAWRDAVNKGGETPELSEFTKAAIVSIGSQVALGLQTNGDRDRFFEAFERVIQETIEARCLPGIRISRPGDKN